ncbi:protein PLASTID MOVEMENT IMPAIRED 1 [Elaeis guineensis]|uniref:Protein PLASTID MOVEMENT IMPAIRED 1 n=1 Tax=Elaeis guineensis var. tenera TaxID=51953 RepID=A0A6I9S176_ELAGV|nr:protein PLASTID MOVEMENT IMPAIRED 1 [Elaeis guineensis]
MADHSNNQILQELDALSHSLYQAHTARRTASLALPRSANPTSDAAPSADLAQSDSRPLSRRMSMSPWRSRPKSQRELGEDEAEDSRRGPPSKTQNPSAVTGATVGEKKGIWNWKPMRALSHIRMQRLGCLFSVEVVAVQGLPASMNGLRLSVAVRKKETKEGAVQTMPSRVLHGSADFEEMLFIRCHVYCSGGSATGKPLKFEARPFLISVVAIGAPELDLGNSVVDLSLLVKESMERSLEGARVRQWDTTFPLSGKAKGGELVLKLGFQIMEDGGIGIYNQAEVGKSSNKGKDSSSPFARKQSKTSFRVSSPRITRPEHSSTPNKEMPAIDLKGIDEFSLDEPGPMPHSSSPSIRKSEPEVKDDLDIPEFEVVEKGVEIKAEKEEEEVAGSGEAADGTSASSEVVKEVVHDTAHLSRLTELDAIAQQIKALESMMMRDGSDPMKTEEGDEMQRLDAEEETVTREFLQMLELEGEKNTPDRASLMKPVAEEGRNAETSVFLSDLGKGLGCIVRTRDGGYLAAMNPFDVEVGRKETPKLAMQISKPLILGYQASGFEVFERLAALDLEELGSKLHSLAAMDELMGKTAEQIAFEGIASAIISGRNKEGASSSAARSVAVLKTMATAMNEGRKERISTGIWNMREEPVTIEEILTFSLQKIEAMAVEALKIQAGMAQEEPPFNVSSLVGKVDGKNPLDSAIPPEDWAKACSSGATMITLLVTIQMRDPLRRYEMVGAPAIAIIQAVRVDDAGDEEGRYKLASLHVGGLKLKSGGRRSIWDGEKQRLTAMQWLVAYGFGKAGKKSKLVQAKSGEDVVWSMSSRVMADMWLKPMRNPDVKVSEQ